MEDVPERVRVSAAVRGCCGRRSVSGDGAGPLAFLVGHPDSGIFQFARFIVEIHLEHGGATLAGGPDLVALFRQEISARDKRLLQPATRIASET